MISVQATVLNRRTVTAVTVHMSRFLDRASLVRQEVEAGGVGAGAPVLGEVAEEALRVHMQARIGHLAGGVLRLWR